MRISSLVAALLLGCLVPLFASAAASPQKRIALVIGNAHYQNTPALANPVNDAEDLAAELTRLGFSVDFERDLTKRGMETAIAHFAREAQGAEAALFYYAGHGMQYRGENYLMPVDAKLEDEFSLNFELTRLDDVLFGLERANGVKVLILDACRDNPLLQHLLRTTKTATRDLAPTRGLAKIPTARGMVVAYSTQMNQVALDGSGRNSPFAQALLKHLEEPKVEIGTLFRRIAIDVNAQTRGRQLPEYSVSLLGDFYVNMRDTDVEAWSKLRDSDDVSRLNGFIKSYPNSTLVPDVKKKLDFISREEQARIAREEAERKRIEQARLAVETAERERLEKERLAREQVEKERLARDQAERERQAQAERDRIGKAKADQDASDKALKEANTTLSTAPEAQTPSPQTESKATTAMLTPPGGAQCPDGSAMAEDGHCEAIKKELEGPPLSGTSRKTIDIETTLHCGAFSANPRGSPPFSTYILFHVTNGKIQGERLTSRFPGKETYSGSIEPTGASRIVAHGRFDSGISVWTTTLSGTLGGHLQGRLTTSINKPSGNGHRDCTLTFRDSARELWAKLGLQGAPAPDTEATPLKPPPVKATVAHPAPSRPTMHGRTGGDATKESFKIIAAGSLPTGTTREYTAPNGRKMTCTGGNIHRNIPRTCFWN